MIMLKYSRILLQGQKCGDSEEAEKGSPNVHPKAIQIGAEISDAEGEW